MDGRCSGGEGGEIHIPQFSQQVAKGGRELHAEVGRLMMSGGDPVAVR
jgi:hypothetical protein